MSLNWTNTREARDIIGRWRVDRHDDDALKRLGDVTIEFCEGGNLTYVTSSPERTEAFLLTYRMENGVIVTHHPLCPGERRTSYCFAGDRLTLTISGAPARFLKI
jgi:hypothetical protein